MAANAIDEILRAADPARALEPLPEAHRLALRDDGTRLVPRPQIRRRRRAVLRVAVAVVAAVVFTSGVAWAGGALSPPDLFPSNPPDDGAAPAGLWGQHRGSGAVPP